MKQFAILGYPLGHTLSPQLHRLLARELGEQIDYQICQIAPEQLEQRLPELFALDGFNITIPYKVRIIDSLDRLDRTARNHGAVNVVGFSAAGERVGYNTDCVGFVRTMQTHGVEIKGDKKTAVATVTVKNTGSVEGKSVIQLDVCHRVRPARLQGHHGGAPRQHGEGRTGAGAHPLHRPAGAGGDCRHRLLKRRRADL